MVYSSDLPLPYRISQIKPSQLKKQKKCTQCTVNNTHNLPQFLCASTLGWILRHRLCVSIYFVDSRALQFPCMPCSFVGPKKILLFFPFPLANGKHSFFIVGLSVSVAKHGIPDTHRTDSWSVRASWAASQLDIRPFTSPVSPWFYQDNGPMHSHSHTGFFFRH